MGAVIVACGGQASVLPAAAFPLIRAADEVFASPGLDPALRELLAVASAPDDLDDLVTTKRIVLVCSTVDEPLVAALRAGGAELIEPPPGAALVSAAAVMDRLRSPGGCPWDAEQTHDSLRKYLIEETYELLEAIEGDDRVALREELGDVLLQVLFHARVAAEHDEPFTIDDVAGELVTKLVNRHPHVFATDGDARVRDAASQNERWEQLKQAEKQRQSCVDGVALGQPALALAAKLAQRTARANLPADLLPTNRDLGAVLLATAARARHEGTDPEAALRAAAKSFAADVRAAEGSARRAGVDPGGMTEQDWRDHWPDGRPTG